MSRAAAGLVYYKGQESRAADNRATRHFYLDFWLLVPALLLLVLGLIMVTSASITIAEKEHAAPFYFFWRQLAYVLAGLLLGWGVLHVRIDRWDRFGPGFLVLGLFLLVLVLLAGREVNGSMRWISLGIVNVQPSELMKLFAVVFFSGYLVRRNEEVRSSMKGFFKPMILFAVIGILLLLEPDFGATAVIAVTALGMLFLAGVKMRQFVLLFMVMALALAVLGLSSPYRMKRLTSFIHPFADPFDSGFQLTQALIAFGRGEWFGVGLGGSIQKLFYLPEAHTDFLFAVLAEELGLFGAAVVIVLFAIIVLRAFKIGRDALRAGHQFAAYLCFGLGLLIGFQAFINIGVNMGVLPTKGLTLPLMSYGGSSVVATCIAIAMLLRVAHEHRPTQTKSRREQE